MAELFTEKDAVSPTSAKPKGPLVRAAKQQPKAVNKQHKKTVGSQVGTSQRENQINILCIIKLVLI